jgi:molybdopterin-guanine dinucleotide biosynthesis protein A/nucleoside-triphosphatase THEP1
VTHPIYILSQPIQSGKTTLINEWIKNMHSVGGILTPDINGSRKLLDIHNQTYYNLQLQDDEIGIKIGRFVFDDKVFSMAREIITKAINGQFEWIVIDEIGRLEINQNLGLEPAISELIEAYKSNQIASKILLIVRDYLLHDVINHYQLNNVVVLEKDFFITPTPLRKLPQSNITGLVLCGGQSVRMGRDKAFIIYHQKEQYAHVAEMLKPICNQVFVSCNGKQIDAISKNYQIVEDNATFQNAGPMTGVLSAFEQYPDTALLVVGCDYPHLIKHDIQALIDAREENIDAICYYHPETKMNEPLIAIYEKQCAPLLLDYFNQGFSSLRHFLNTVNTKRLLPEDLTRMKSVDF